MTEVTAAPVSTLYTATVEVAGGRGGTARSLTGSLHLTLSRPAQRGPDAPGTDPEELFAAGFAACFDSALAVAARRSRVTVGPTTVTASVSLGTTVDKRYAIAVELAVQAPQCPQGELERLVAEAEQLCPYANAIRGNTPVVIQAYGSK
jgi:osmotically inducible protein OsmC